MNAGHLWTKTCFTLLNTINRLKKMFHCSNYYSSLLNLAFTSSWIYQLQPWQASILLIIHRYELTLYTFFFLWAGFITAQSHDSWLRPTNEININGSCQVVYFLITVYSLKCCKISMSIGQAWMHVLKNITFSKLHPRGAFCRHRLFTPQILNNQIYKYR